MSFLVRMGPHRFVVPADDETRALAKVEQLCDELGLEYLNPEIEPIDEGGPDAA